MKKNGNGGIAIAPKMKESAQAIWLAGLGVFATAGDEGNKIFHQMVKRGEQADRANKAQVRKLISKAEGLRGDAGSAITRRIAKPIDKGVTTALHRLGVPTRDEILSLTKRVEALTKAVGREQARRPAKAHKHTATAAV